MEENDLRLRLKSIKKNMYMSYTSIGIYCGLSYNEARQAISHFVNNNYPLSNEQKIKADRFLKLFGY